MVIVPMRNGAGDAIGMIVVARDFSGTRSASGRSLVWQIFYALWFVSLGKSSVDGWYGEAAEQMVIGLGVSRQPGKLIAPIFIPLLASLLIPLLAIWMNQPEGGGFRVEAFELANIIIGGLFAVIALNFTINDGYTMVAAGDNSVTRLFGLNYLTLATSLLVIVLMFRFQVLRRLFGRYVQEQVFVFLSWAIPALVFGTAATFLLVAMV